MSRVDSSIRVLESINVGTTGSIAIHNALGSGLAISVSGNDRFLVQDSLITAYNNMTISGILLSPLTSLLGTSVGVLDTFRTIMTSTSMPQYLTRNETTLPSSFLASSLTSVGTLSSLVDSGALTVSGVLQSPLTSLLGVSVGVLDTFRTIMTSTSMPQYLTRNETTLPSSFLASSLTSVGTLSSLSVSGAGSFQDVSGTGLTVKSQTSTSTIKMGMANASDGQIVSSADTYFYTNTGTNPLRLTGSAGIFSGNLTISGTLQSPLTSLLGVSYVAHELKITNLSTSSAVLDTFRTVMTSTSMPQFLSRNETILPSTFTTYILNDNLVFNAQANANSYIQFQSTGTTNNSFYIGKVGTDLVENYTNNLIFKKVGTETSRIDSSGNWIMSNNLNVSGTLQSPLTSLLGVSYVAHELKITNLSTSSAVLDTFRTIMTSTSQPQYLTRNETILPSTFATLNSTSLATLGNFSVSGILSATSGMNIGVSNYYVNDIGVSTATFINGGGGIHYNSAGEIYFFDNFGSNAWSNAYWPLDSPSNFVLNMDAQWSTHGGVGAANMYIYFGAQVRSDGNSTPGYVFTISRNDSAISSFAFTYNGSSSGFTVVTNNTISISAGIYNPIQIIRDRETWSFYFTGTLFYQVVDTSYPRVEEKYGQGYLQFLSFSGFTSFASSFYIRNVKVTPWFNNKDGGSQVGFNYVNYDSFVKGNLSVSGTAFLTTGSIGNLGVINNLSVSANLAISGTLQVGGSYLFGDNNNRCTQTSDHMTMTNSISNASYTQYTDTSGSSLVGHFNSGTFFRDNQNRNFRFENAAGTNLINLSVTSANPSFFTNNLNVSGVFQSPLTSLLGVSYVAHELKITNLSTSSAILDTFRSVMTSTSMPQYLTRNETILPASFASILRYNDNTAANNSGGLSLNSGGTNSFMVFTNNQGANFSIGAYSTNFQIGNGLSMDSTGNVTTSQTVTANGTFIAAGTARIPNIGTTANPNTIINLSDNTTFNSGGTNCYLNFRGTSQTTSSNVLFGILTHDMFHRLALSTGKYVFQDSSATTILSISGVNGTVLNTSGVYSSLSDSKLKSDIEDARDYTADFKEIQFRKFTMKSSGERYLGVIAQELETIFPGLVEESEVMTNHVNDTVKSVKMSILHTIAMVVLQKLIARVDQVESRLATYESNV